jgi:hypothetical protein
LDFYHLEEIQKVNSILYPRVDVTTLTGGVPMTSEVIPIYAILIRNHMVNNIHVSTTVLSKSMNKGNNSAGRNLW